MKHETPPLPSWPEAAPRLVAVAAGRALLAKAANVLALVYIPELRLSDLGLVDVGRYQFTSLTE
ncbi:MAG: hypothetical protein JSR87_04080 [Proteobacteria bacterium]|nr:hypothetical protein [Pseudomonadota bacterium]MBS0572057.1 hypothetical protein [Pseudomonadota bacterium]